MPKFKKDDVVVHKMSADGTNTRIIHQVMKILGTEYYVVIWGDTVAIVEAELIEQNFKLKVKYEDGCIYRSENHTQVFIVRDDKFYRLTALSDDAFQWMDDVPTDDFYEKSYGKLTKWEPDHG